MRRHDIFVSYSRVDRSAAQRISARLEQEGFSVWWDAAIHSGESFHHAGFALRPLWPTVEKSSFQS
jgi:hypothetical protein